MEREHEKGSVIVIAPHPDDEVIGCGGTIYKHTREGVKVHLCVVTDGSKLYEKTDVERRKQECLRVSEILGIRRVIFLDFPDGELTHHLPELRSSLGKVIADFQKVYAPHPFDHHPDHIAVSLSILSIFEERPLFELYLYGVYNTFRYNLLVDVTDIYNVKREALLEYAYSLGKSQLMIKRTEAFMRYPTIHTGEDRLYEAFFFIDKHMTLNNVLGFLSYDLLCQDPQNELLKKIKSTQILIEELKKERNMRIFLENKLKSCEEESKRLKLYEKELDKLRASLFFKVYDAYHTLKPRLIPHGSLRERFYRKLINIIKGV